jgi:phage RecT family recombinase
MTDTGIATVATSVNRPPIVVMRERFESRKDELKKALPSDVSPDVFIRAFMTSAQLNPELQACTWQSLWEAALRACRDGLLPDGVEAAVVPFKSKAQYIRMYGGVLRQFRRSGQFKWLKTDVVREGEKFEHWVTNAGEHFLHVPGDDFNAPIIKAYALATTKDGGEFCKVMSRAEIDKHRSFSRAQRDDSPWKVWFEAMAQKTAIIQLAKILPNARDIVGDEDLPELDEAPSTAPAPIARAPGAAAALDQFSRASQAGDSPHPVTVDDAREEGEERGTIDATSAARNEADRDPAPTDDHYAHFQNVAAFKRGQEAKAAGHQRKAIPPEYRESDRTREALAWEAGWSGQSMPEFKEQDHG